jgi:gentisate 1,2-dioxygenase
MGRPPVPRKCRDCAVNLLTKADALKVHGPEGDNCWEGKPCQDKRARLRDPLLNAKRQQKRKVASGVVTYALEPTGVYAPILHLYRATTTSPLHALGAALFYSDPVHGDSLVAEIEVLHTLGLTEAGVETKFAEILQQFSQTAGKPLTRFRAVVEKAPSRCPLPTCPLRPRPGTADVSFKL